MLLPTKSMCFYTNDRCYFRQRDIPVVEQFAVAVVSALCHAPFCVFVTWVIRYKLAADSVGLDGERKSNKVAPFRGVSSDVDGTLSLAEVSIIFRTY